MLQINQINDAHCQGIEFKITDIAALAQAIAVALVQEYSLARLLITGASFPQGNIALDQSDVDDIIKRRLHPTVDYHRDGFLFQLMMWLSAHIDLPGEDLVALPHSQCSAKGQDSIIVHRSNQAVVALTICEDKATENPRQTVRDEVWPEIEEYEKGGRRDELRSNVIATLGTGGIAMPEAENLIRGISWAGKRRYRVRVTVESNGRTPKLFKGFEQIVDGDLEMRRGETATLPSLRSWMDNLAGLVESELRQFATGA